MVSLTKTIRILSLIGTVALLASCGASQSGTFMDENQSGLSTIPTQPTVTFSPISKFVNVNGDTYTLRGSDFLDLASAGVVITGGEAFTDSTNTPLEPEPGDGLPLLRGGYRNTTGVMSARTPVENGNYDVYFLTFEVETSTTFSVAVEGRSMATNLSSGAPGTWTRYGPFRTLVTDGSLELTISGGPFNLSTIELMAR